MDPMPAQSATRPGRLRLWLLLALLVASLLAVGYSWLARPQPAGPAGPPIDYSVPPPSRVTKDIEVVDTVPSPATPGAPVANDRPANASGHDPETRYRYLVLRLFLPDRSPAQDIELCILLGGAGPGRALKADAEGRLQVRVPRATGQLIVRANDLRLFFTQREVNLVEETTELEIQVERLATLQLRVTYDDGTPFTGVGSVMSDAKEPRPHQFDPETLDVKSGGRGFRVEDGRATLTGLRWMDVRLRFYTERAGYDVYSEPLPADEIVDGAQRVVVIKPSKHPMGSMVLDFGDYDWQTERSWSYDVTNLSRPPLRNWSQFQNPPKDNELLVHPLLEGLYRVSVNSGKLCWVANVEVKAGAAARAPVALALACRVSALVLDEAGNPLSGAVIMPDYGDYPTYPAVARSGFHGVSDARGKALLDGLSATTDRIVIEADGYEPQVLAVALHAGSETDAGTVRLAPATGRIIIRLLNARQGMRYSAMLNHPLGRGGRTPPREVPSSLEMVFDGLPLREYLAAVSPYGGGKIASGRARLTPEQREVIVELDVSELVPRNR